ncbi:hypothetical protein DMENIID0001_148310 [Sergentomyia squamirostris]
MKTVVFLLFIFGIVNLAVSFQSNFPLNPDDIRWASQTCAYELKPTPEEKQNWKYWMDLDLWLDSDRVEANRWYADNECMEKENKEEWEQFVKFLDEVTATYEYPETSSG